ncbi:MAG: hypothetical protein ACR2G0_03785 [Chthoniobacterales bacterium]
MAAVTARISGRDLGSTAADVKRVGFLPNNVPYVKGNFTNNSRSRFAASPPFSSPRSSSFSCSSFSSTNPFRVTIAMILITLFAIAGVYIGLWVTGTEFNIISRMGMTMIVGIVTEVAIFYSSEFAETEDAGNASERFITAG